jgi:hypothetical protein
MKSFILGEMWKGRSETPQERVHKELQTIVADHCCRLLLQTTITDSIARDGMGQDKTVSYRLGFNNHLSLSKCDRFPLQFTRDCVPYSTAAFIR